MRHAQRRELVHDVGDLDPRLILAPVRVVVRQAAPAQVDRHDAPGPVPVPREGQREIVEAQ